MEVEGTNCFGEGCECCKDCENTGENTGEQLDKLSDGIHIRLNKSSEVTSNTSIIGNEYNVMDTLKQRGSIYGSYGNACAARVDIMAVLKNHHFTVNREAMDEEVAMGMSDIVLKLVRAAGKPSYSDSWHDLAGYATLMENESKKVG